MSRAARGPQPQRRLRCHRGRPRRLVHRREGPDRLPDRQQRRGQDHDAAHDLRSAAAGRPARSCSRASRSTTQPAHAILGTGIAHCPEGRRLFPRMTVEENLQLGAYVRKDDGVAADMQRVYELFPVLGERRHNKAGLFSGGEQQMLAIGRAMMSKPRLLMLDEPSMGLSPIMTQLIFDTIKELQSLGHHDPAGGAERAGGAGAVRPRLRDRPRPDHCGRTGARAARRPAGARRLPRRGLTVRFSELKVKLYIRAPNGVGVEFYREELGVFEGEHPVD